MSTRRTLNIYIAIMLWRDMGKPKHVPICEQIWKLDYIFTSNFFINIVKGQNKLHVSWHTLTEFI